jgi:hypothetical protein
MFAEVAKPVALVFCILSLYALFNAAFLSLSIDMHQRICDSLSRLALAAAVCWISGLIFSDAYQDGAPAVRRLTTTLPVRLFCWASVAMLVLFVVSWYLETHCIFYRDVRF